MLNISRASGRGLFINTYNGSLNKQDRHLETAFLLATGRQASVWFVYPTLCGLGDLDGVLDSGTKNISNKSSRLVDAHSSDGSWNGLQCGGDGSAGKATRYPVGVLGRQLHCLVFQHPKVLEELFGCMLECKLVILSHIRAIYAREGVLSI